MKILPFFFPLGALIPVGVIMFNFGIPSSSSVYTFRLPFLAAENDLVFCCFGGGSFDARLFFDLEILDLDFGPWVCR